MEFVPVILYISIDILKCYANIQAKLKARLSGINLCNEKKWDAFIYTNSKKKLLKEVADILSYKWEKDRIYQKKKQKKWEKDRTTW